MRHNIWFAKDDPNGSNGSSPDANVKVDYTGVAEIDGYKARVGEDENGDIVVEAPEDLPADKLAGFTAKAEEYGKTLSAAKKKNLDLNKEKEELETERRRLEAEKAEFEAQKRALTMNPPAPQPNGSDSETEMIKRHFGVNSWQEVEDLRTDNPDKFYQANANYQAEISARAASKAAGLETMRSQMRTEGYDPSEVEVFARAKGITDLNTAFDYYKRVNDKPKGKSLHDLNNERKVRVAPASKGMGDGKPPAGKVQKLNEIIPDSV